jgi:hypothetical protein
MLKIYTLFFLLLLSQPLLSQDKAHKQLDSITISNNDQEGYSFKFTMVIEKFDSAIHDISRVRDNIIDGNYVYGTDGSIPQKEIKTFSCIINGKQIPVKPEFYNRLYNPAIGYENSTLYLTAFWGSDYKSIFVFMNGGDGAGSYTAVWSLRADGKHTFMKPAYSDELYFDFHND